MAVPKRKTSPSRRGMRRAHDAYKIVNPSTCNNCGTTKRSHHICTGCGQYRGRQVLNISEKL